MKITKILCLFMALLSPSLWAADELIVIQAVSTSGKTFAIRRGVEQGIAKGQESLFTNRTSSFTAKATDVSRNFSVWQLVDMRGAVPFGKGDFVTFSNSIENVWVEIPKIALNAKELGFKAESNWIIKGGYSLALSESVTETDAARFSGRSGLQTEILYSHKFRYNMSFNTGLRFDQESSTYSNPEITVTSNRTLVTGGLVYHFENFNRSDNNIYIGVGLGYGLSSTTISDNVQAGTTTMIPSVQLGYINRLTSSYAFIFEAAIESFSSKESYEDGKLQSSNFVNSRLSVGMQF